MGLNFKYTLHNYTSISTQVQVHKYKYTITSIQLRVQKYKYTSTSTQVLKSSPCTSPSSTLHKIYLDISILCFTFFFPNPINFSIFLHTYFLLHILNYITVFVQPPENILDAKLQYIK